MMKDFDCAEDITADWALAPNDRVAYMQACYRRLYLSGLFYAKPPGSYGTPVERFLNDPVTEAQMTAMIVTELLKDSRTRDVKVSWANNVATIKVSPHQGDDFFISTEQLTGPVAED